MATLEAKVQAEVKASMDVSSNPTRAALEKVSDEATAALNAASSAVTDLIGVISKSDLSLAQGKQALSNLAKVIADSATPAPVAEACRFILAEATNSGLGGDAARNTLAAGCSLALKSINMGVEAIRQLAKVINKLPPLKADAVYIPALPDIVALLALVQSKQTAKLQAEVKTSKDVSSNPTRAALEHVYDEASAAISGASGALGDLIGVIAKSDSSLAKGKKAIEDLGKVIGDPTTPPEVADACRFIKAEAGDSGLGGEVAKNTLATGKSLAEQSIANGVEPLRQLAIIISALPPLKASATVETELKPVLPALVFSDLGKQSANTAVVVQAASKPAETQQANNSGCRIT